MVIFESDLGFIRPMKVDLVLGFLREIIQYFKTSLSKIINKIIAKWLFYKKTLDGGNTSMVYCFINLIKNLLASMGNSS